MLLKTLKIGNLSIQVPIIQGGMGVGISLSGLASAVANEGGVGVISAAGLGVIYKNLSKNYLEASILGLKEEGVFHFPRRGRNVGRCRFGSPSGQQGTGRGTVYVRFLLLGTYLRFED